MPSFGRTRSRDRSRGHSSASPLPFAAVSLDPGTLVPFDLTDPGWAAAYPSDAVTVTAQADTDGVAITSYLMNSAGNASGKGQIGWQFVAQGTTTSFTIRAKRDPANPTLNTVGFVLYNSTGAGGLLAFTVPALTASFADYNFTATTVVGTAYRLALVTNQAGIGTNTQARMIVASVKVTPTVGASGIFAGSYQRLNVNAAALLDQDWKFYYPAYSQWTSQARLALKVIGATSIGVEISAGGSPAQNIAVRSNGVYGTAITPAGLNGALEVQTLTVTDGATLDLIDGPNTNPSSPTGTGSTAGDHVRAIYVASGATIFKQGATTGRHVVAYGDSITSGIGASTPGQTSSMAILRDALAQSRGHLTHVSWGGRSLYEDYSLGGNAWTTLVAEITALAPTDLYIAIGTNDKSRDDWATHGHVAAFTTQLTALFVAIHAALPNARIWARKPPPNSTAGSANGSGEVLSAYQNAYATAATGLAYVTVIDMATVVYNGTNYNVDGVHPTDVGYAAFAVIDRAAMGI